MMHRHLVQDTTAHPSAADGSDSNDGGPAGPDPHTPVAPAVGEEADLDEPGMLDVPAVQPVRIPRDHSVGGSGLPLPTLPASQHDAESRDPEELERLEALLAERARELLAERAEDERLRALLRDSLERFAAMPPPGADPAELHALRAEHARAVERAVEAEAARAEAAFRLDEVMGHLLAAGAAEGPVPNEPAQITYARLSGRVRGLCAALAESEEARDMAQAQRLLVEHDLEDARERITQLSRQLVEAREHAELAEVQTHVLDARLEGSLDARTAGVLRGQVLGARARLEESERALATLGEDLEIAELDAVALREALGQARAELAALRSESSAKHGRISELDLAVARETESAREAKAELIRLQAERLVLSDELARARAELRSSRAGIEELRAERLRARDEADSERALARQAAAERHARAERMGDALREVKALLGELPSALGRALAPEAQASRDPTLPGTLSAFEGAHLAGADSDETLPGLETRVAEAVRALRGLQEAPEAERVRAEITALLRLLELS